MTENRIGGRLEPEVEQNVATIQHALNMIDALAARSDAAVSLGRLAVWADRGLYQAKKEATTHVIRR